MNSNMLKKCIVILLSLFLFSTEIVHAGTIKTDKQLKEQTEKDWSLLKIFETNLTKALEVENLIDAQKALLSMNALVSLKLYTLEQACSKKMAVKCKDSLDEQKAYIDSLFIKFFASHDELFPHPENLNKRAEALIKGNLLDPDSAQFRFKGEPQKSYGNTGFGWKVEGEFNAKNRMGGYNGFVPFLCYALGEKPMYCELSETDELIVEK